MEQTKRSRFKLLFYLKKNKPKKKGNAPIMPRITMDGNPKTFGTKLEINADIWDLKIGRDLGKKCRSNKSK
ncbi:Arm DNA-binding domain-containing protein [Sphingobacterium daejeonense]|uniref:Arm DNA-binding domain-containing protein n=1 Tax=Sphingobacterium daejeonense TaxID=371142 RepID=UPI0010C3E57F|nr:Arm DNA-binding domain-containing protein [Sphingobacterium daejeonense]VTP93979.1 Uncharacterised protein [Sphingobacterium daejeonense]